MFADSDSVMFYFNTHKKAVCAYLGHSARFFGFKWRVSKPQHIPCIFDFLRSICTVTYFRLCEMAGRPNILQIARRAADVIQKQFLEDG